MNQFKILGINHLGLAAKDPAKCAWFLRDVLGLEHLGDELVASQKTMTNMYSAIRPFDQQESAFSSRLEILAPQAGTTDGPISRYLDKKGGGIHHLALAVDKLRVVLAHLKEKNVRLIDDEPRPGAHNTLIAFVHPESTGGLLIELVEEQ